MAAQTDTPTPVDRSEPTMTVEAIVAELTDMLAATRDHPSLSQRLLGSGFAVLYEFVPDHGGEPRPHVMRVGQHDRSLTAGAVPYEDVDIVIRARPVTLHRLTSGDLSGREAIVSGVLDIRKAPSLPTLLLMRGLFNQYKKLLARQTRATDDGDTCGVIAAAEHAEHAEHAEQESP